MNRRTLARPRSGYSLVEIVIVLGILAVLGAAALPATSALDQWALSRAARLVTAQMIEGRLLAVARRDRIRLRVVAPGTLETVDGAGAVIDRRVLAGPSPGLVDSVRIRPSAIRYNPRGHGAAGSVYLFRNGRGVRVISNFLGRIRRHGFRF